LFRAAVYIRFVETELMESDPNSMTARYYVKSILLNPLYTVHYQKPNFTYRISIGKEEKLLHYWIDCFLGRDFPQKKSARKIPHNYWV